MNISAREKNECCGCEACKNICPLNCISMLRDNEGFLYPSVNATLCIDCGKCVQACPFFTENNEGKCLNTYIAYNKDDEIRRNSSSGGVFFELAKLVISLGGVVYGPHFNSEMKLKYERISQMQDISLLMGSKYLQADAGDVHKSVKADLVAQKYVLFSGTSCYVKSVKNSIPVNLQDNLICVDFICHGVPSPGVFDAYLKYISKKSEKEPADLFFRDKSVSWESFGMKITYTDGSKEIINKNSDCFLKGFLDNLYLRPSCHTCKVKGFKSGSDIKLGDCWHIARSAGNDHKGMSTVFINTEKGLSIWNRVKTELVFSDTELKKEISENTAIMQSTPMHKNRNKFFEEYKYKPFDELIAVYDTVSGKQKIKGLIKKLLNKAKRRQ